jgi:hypothetical protein
VVEPKRRRIHAAAVALVLTGLTLPVIATAVPASAATTCPGTRSGNLIHNPDAEKGAGSPDGGVVPVPRWLADSHGVHPLPTQVRYGGVEPSGLAFPTATDPGPKNRGSNLFAGGPDRDFAFAYQDIPLEAFAAAIDSGSACYTLQGWLGGFSSQKDNAYVGIEFSSPDGSFMIDTLKPVTNVDRHDQTGLLKRKAVGAIPPGTRSVLVAMEFTRVDGTYNDAYIDGLSLNVTTS